jgi:cation diffusion facilitator CzcD-associated flavoprotein CzcO
MNSVLIDVDHDKPLPTRTPDYEVIVVGAGFSGLAAGRELRLRGIEKFLILDRADGVGGTWRQNTYPGIEVDVPSMAYSYRFAPNPNWSRVYAPGSELLQYAEDCADSFGLRPHLRFDTTITAMRFDTTTDLWSITIDGEKTPLTSRFVISCHGALSTPARPDIPGLTEFAGKVIYSQDWDHAYPLDGQRVGLIGTGASGIQIAPEIAARTASLAVFQRTPIYVSPKVNPVVPPAVKRSLQKLPAAARVVRSAADLAGDMVQVVGVIHYQRAPGLSQILGSRVAASMRGRISDPELQQKLIPEYGFGCKRPGASSQYLETFQRARGATLVTDPIERIVADGIRTAGGTVHEIDTLILATGFKVFDLPYTVIGTNDHDLQSFWDTEGMSAYQGISVPGYPNLFLAPGPYGVAGFNWFDTIDLCTTHAAKVIHAAIGHHATRAEVKRTAFDDFMQHAKQRAQNLLFTSPACTGAHSYYIAAGGDTPFLRPFSTLASKRKMRAPYQSYEFTGNRSRTPHPTNER